MLGDIHWCPFDLKINTVQHVLELPFEITYLRETWRSTSVSIMQWIFSQMPYHSFECYCNTINFDFAPKSLLYFIVHTLWMIASFHNLICREPDSCQSWIIHGCVEIWNLCRVLRKMSNESRQRTNEISFSALEINSIFPRIRVSLFLLYNKKLLQATALTKFGNKTLLII